MSYHIIIPGFVIIRIISKHKTIPVCYPFKGKEVLRNISNKLPSGIRVTKHIIHKKCGRSKWIMHHVIIAR